MGTTYSYYMGYDEIYNTELINSDYCSRIWKSHTKYLEEDNIKAINNNSVYFNTYKDKNERFYFPKQ